MMSHLRVVVDLPLIDEDTGVFRDEVAIERCVSGGAKMRDLFFLEFYTCSHMLLYV